MQLSHGYLQEACRRIQANNQNLFVFDAVLTNL
jgi:hypothetical protein